MGIMAATLARRALLVLLLLRGAVAHPSWASMLECGTDETTRLKLGAKIMNAEVRQAGLLDDVVLENTCWGGVMVSFGINAPNGTYMAFRVMGGGQVTTASMLPFAGGLNYTQQSDGTICYEQVFTNVATGGTYGPLKIQNGTNKTTVVVGSWNGKVRPFGGKVHLSTADCSEALLPEPSDVRQAH